MFIVVMVMWFMILGTGLRSWLFSVVFLVGMIVCGIFFVFNVFVLGVVVVYVFLVVLNLIVVIGVMVVIWVVSW